VCVVEGHDGYGSSRDILPRFDSGSLELPLAFGAGRVWAGDLRVESLGFNASARRVCLIQGRQEFVDGGRGDDLVLLRLIEQAGASVVVWLKGAVGTMLSPCVPSSFSPHDHAFAAV
jgi:hypothetical protein